MAPVGMHHTSQGQNIEQPVFLCVVMSAAFMHFNTKSGRVRSEPITRGKTLVATNSQQSTNLVRPRSKQLWEEAPPFQ